MNRIILNEIAEIIMGQSPESKFVSENLIGLPLLNGPAEFTEKYPIPVQYTSNAKRIAEINSILFCVRGSTTGRMNIADQKYAIGRGLAAIRHKHNESLNIYVKALIELNIKKLLGGTLGSVFPNLTKDNLFNLECFVHSKEEQKQIAKVLSDLDTKIEVNNKINQQLEAMAKLVYDYWFVQFDFPMSKDYANAIGKPELTGKPYKTSGGKMVYNAELKREIPEGWEDGILSDIAEITMGQSPAGSSYNQKGIGTLFYQGSTDFGLRFPTVRQYTTEPSRMAQKGDVLLSVRAPVGTINQAMEDCCIGRGLASLREKKGSISYLWSQMVYFKQIFDRKNASGTTFGAITKNELFGLKVSIPNEQVLNNFKEIVDPLHDKIIVCSKENQKLAELRDWLLPMLMNGQVSVKGTYKEAEDVAMSPNNYRQVAEDDVKYGKE